MDLPWLDYKQGAKIGKVGILKGFHSNERVPFESFIAANDTAFWGVFFLSLEANPTHLEANL